MEREIDKVKRKLWQFGFKAREVKNIPGVDYDLLVADQYPVKVIREEDRLAVLGNQRGTFIVAVVGGDSISYHICKRGRCWEETSPLKAFPVINPQ